MLTDVSRPCREKKTPPSLGVAGCRRPLNATPNSPSFGFLCNFFALKCAGFRGLPAAGKPSTPSHTKSQTSSVTSYFYQGNGCDRALLGVANQAWLFAAALQSEAVAVRLCHVRRLEPTSEMVVRKKYK